MDRVPLPGFSRFDELLRYVRLDEADRTVLHRLRDCAEDQFPAIAREFHERVRQHTDAHAVFASEEQAARQDATLQAWMRRVLTGPYDADYFAKSWHIGERHVLVGLPQRFVIVAMAVIRGRFQEIALARLGADAPAACTALAKVLDLELAVMCESYREALLERIKRVERDNKTSALRTLEKNERRYMRAVELATTVIVGLGTDGTVQLFNREAERVMGYSASEVLGQPFAARFVEAPEECGWDEGWGELTRAGAHITVSVPAQCVVRSKSRKLRQLEGQMSRGPKDGDDEPLVFLVARDVSDERALASRLRQSEKLAAVGTLAAGLAHEIRNPLNGAQLHLTFLRRALTRSGLNGDMMDAVDVVDGEIKRLSALVTDFLSFARPRPLQRRSTELQELCTRVADVVGPAAEKAGAKVRLQLPEPAILADVDPTMVEQALLNLLNNAVEALDGTAGGTVTVKLAKRPFHVVLEVHDDGPGIADPQAPIFDAFYSTKANGTGLGLAIVHRVVTDHGGDIEVQSQPGATVFRITLPLRDPDLGPPSQSVPVVRSPAGVEEPEP